jgi:lipopolysaccharide export system protein LptC
MWERWVRRGLLALSLILAASLGYLLVTRSDSGSSSRSVSAVGKEPADARIQDFTFTQTKGEIVQWKVQAEQARLFEAENRAILSNVQITLYGAQGQELTLSGEEGDLDTHTKNFNLFNRSKPIVVETQSGYTIYTNHLAWTDARHEIRTDEHVTIDGHGLQVTGRGLLGKLDTEEFQVLDDVRVDVVPASS